MSNIEAIGRFIYGMILQDDASNAWPLGCSSLSGDTFTFTVGMDPDGGLGEVVVRIAVSALPTKDGEA